jgi:uncharacterized DUF497 family protein
VAESFRYQFEWDSAKAHDNLTKHAIGFEQAATVFRDPLAVTVYDSEHSAAEERWATLGRSESGTLFVVIHTFAETSANSATVRIISARRATKKEVRDYEAPAR